MVGRNKGWRTNWSRLENGRLQHTSGLEFEFDEALGMCTCDDTVEAFQAAELARGVPLHQLVGRICRLAKEAAIFTMAADAG